MKRMVVFFLVLSVWLVGFDVFRDVDIIDRDEYGSYYRLQFTGITFAGEKEELQWKARALVAEATVSKLQSDLGQCRSGHNQQAIQDLIKELDSKGYVIQQDGTIAERPKPPVDKPKPTVPGGEK